MKSSIVIILCITGSSLLLSCASNKKKEPIAKEEQVQNEKPKAELPIDVGSIHTSLEVLSISDTKIMRVKVLEVLGYGANTSPLNTGKEMTLSFHESISTSDIKVGDTIRAMIRKNASGMGMKTSGSSQEWTVSKLTD